MAGLGESARALQTGRYQRATAAEAATGNRTGTRPESEIREAMVKEEGTADESTAEKVEVS
jgi:hypothetical protein